MNKDIDAEVLTQPVNSPDTNLLDLGFSMWYSQQTTKLHQERVR